jgi:uncharacterized protein (TIGR02594 family)
MPYQQGSGPPILDVYNSPNVFVNNVRVALWLPPGASETASVGANLAIAPVIAPTLANAATLEQYISSPDSFVVESNDQVKRNFPGEVQQSDEFEPLISDASGSDIEPFLTQLLGEADKGVWEETGMGGRPSNNNIIGIWKELGYPQSGPWLTDQTPWCMGFVNWVLKRTGYRYIQTAWARDIQTRAAAYGATQIPLNQGQPGDVALWSYGHVNFVYSAQSGRYTFVGGNQSSRAKNNNNPSQGSITRSWPGGYAPPGDRSLVGLWRPTRTAPPSSTPGST